MYPSVYESVKAHVKAGRFHPVGGSWLEHDCLLPSGESLCRQYMYGQRYFRRKFGVQCREAWLPDTFGYASQLPQILRLAGIDYFFTQKVSQISRSLVRPLRRAALLEQHQRLPPFHIPMDWAGRITGPLAHDPGRQLQRSGEFRGGR